MAEKPDRVQPSNQENLQHALSRTEAIALFARHLFGKPPRPAEFHHLISRLISTLERLRIDWAQQFSV